MYPARQTCQIIFIKYYVTDYVAWQTQNLDFINVSGLIFTPHKQFGSNFDFAGALYQGTPSPVPMDNKRTFSIDSIDSIWSDLVGVTWIATHSHSHSQFQPN